MSIALIVHGGAWAIPDDELADHLAGCRRALAAGWRVLEAGGCALDAVEAAVRVMEDDPTFDAGRGSVLNADGVVELDAALMDGQTLRSGAIAAVQRVAAPISLARRVLESDTAMLVGPGAERFAQAAGLALCDPRELVVERELRRWEQMRAQGGPRVRDAFGDLPQPGDTVGAVALDQAGHLAAGSSTGGTAGKPPGRVGDSPLVGCGLYADDQSGAATCTGWGESIIRVALAKSAADRLGQGLEPQQAARSAVELLARRAQGLGGVILLDRRGRAGLAFNTPRMAYAYRDAAGQEHSGV